MTVQEDDLKILLSQRDHLFNTEDFLKAALEELDHVGFGSSVTIHDQGRVKGPIVTAQDKIVTAIEETRKALAWCLVIMFELVNEIEKET